ncbi:hypothetical protein jhhlp_004864 [Lomentospora prolificans]|uniref:Haloacid dehalogenase, type II n=1 Tax=Lomentospora prolificans TaxID=41688 RepID=A0A2N3N7P7_9PEZI|nr:hypothetical protein jhhlp_004864 [Lomentospora prolificans]
MANGSLPLQNVRALVFDVFGTSVDWRSTVVAEVYASWTAKAQAADLPEQLRGRLKALSRHDSEQFSQQWRDSYGQFTSTFVPGHTPWKDIDTHHYDSLLQLLDKWQLSDVYTDAEARELSLVWHRLGPWPDSAQGLRKLGSRYTTATLSNGNPELLNDLNKMVNGQFQVIISAADFSAYKPNPRVYNGAAEKLGLPTDQVALVAAHLRDLDAARGCGMKTIYVERLGEEDCTGDEVEEARRWVDVWVSLGEEGFVEVARRLGVGEDMSDS